jgi:hypothetical protein
MSLKDPGSFEWKILYGVTGSIDVIQWILDFTGVGDVASEIADPCIGIALASYLQIRGIPTFNHLKRALSLIGGDLAEQFSVQVLPAWIFDVWYIHRTVKEEWAMQQASLIEEQEDQENQPLNRMVNGQSMRRPPVIKPLNQGNVRLPNGGF